VAFVLYVKQAYIKDGIVTSNTKFKGKILVVEDHEDMRDLAVDILANEGFKVITAGDAISGLEQFKRHFDVDLVFTDLILPGGASGIDMAKKILEINPRTQILLTSGYRAKGEALKYKTAKLPNISYVPKPYDVDELLQIIYSLIGKAAFQ
jgi:DNA-binding NtrC family response regulator|tara:strand:+ start:4138 stop:4590 length:453 start_codon:yes stop_codon:yes gene_type:complete